MKKTLLSQLIGNDRGFGDTIERTINKVSGGRVNSCGGCKKTKDFLNKYLPYAKSSKI